jgi:hypothetical protein
VDGEDAVTMTVYYADAEGTTTGGQVLEDIPELNVSLGLWWRLRLAQTRVGGG